METKLVQKFGNSGHIIVPKDYVGKRVKFLLEPKTFDDIKYGILEILKPHLENILGVYLYGSYARNEQTVDSDVDILVITNDKLKVNNKIGDYSIVSITLKALENTLENNAILILPIIKESKAIINPNLLEKYKDCKFTKKNTKLFIDSCKKILEFNKKGLGLNFEIGSLIYSLILRIRSLLMIKLFHNNKHYSKNELFIFLENNKIAKNKVEEFYSIYSKESGNKKVRESSIIKDEDIKQLISIAENLLAEVQSSFK